jgi:hypothetical protein
MAVQRQGGLHRGMRPAHPEKRATDQYPARLFPIQHEIQKLEDELNAFNERIAELKNEGHKSLAMDVLKAKALDFARQIDELRCLLAVSTPKPLSAGASKNRR